MHTATATMENSMEFPQEIKVELSYDAAIPLPDVYKKKSEILS